MVLSFAAQESAIGQGRMTRVATDPPELMSTLQGGLPMLVLSRKVNEKVMVGDDIVITIVKIDRNQVRIGISAPGHVPVYREEILPATWHSDKEDSAEVVISL